MAAGDREQPLDVLRAVAVLAVMIRHLVPPGADSSMLHSVYTVLHECGWLGVDLFFVLSGFLVSGLLFREYATHGNIHAGRFLIRRGFKIYPSFYVFLAVTFLLAHGEQGAPTKTDLIEHIVFIQNYVARQPSIWIHTWSLAVEEHFYLLLTLIFFLWLRKKLRMPTMREATTAVLLIGGAVAAMRVITYFFLDHQVNEEAILRNRLFTTHLRIDALTFGVFLSYLRAEQKASWDWLGAHRKTLLGVGLLMLAPSLVLGNETAFTSLVGFTIYYLGMGALLVFASTAPPKTERRNIIVTSLAMMGTYSYSIYLWHLAVKRWEIPVMRSALGIEPSWFVATAVYFAGSVVVGIVIARIIEFPLLHLRDVWFPSRSRLNTPAQVSPTQVHA